MNSIWKYYDIMDLEYFFQQDSDTAGDTLHERDRRIYLDHGGSAVNDQAPSSLLVFWLAARRQAQEEGTPPLPGTLFHEAHSLLRLLLICFGLISGAGGGLAFFSYSGTTPVNVLHFLLLFVFSQLLLITLILARAGMHTIGMHNLPRSIFIRALGSFTMNLIARLSHRASSNLPGDKRLAVAATLGRMRVALATYPGLLFWPLFTLLQITAIFFNLGLLAATFFRIAVSDIAFGWQSTLQFSAQSLHTAVSWLALPWSWLFSEGTGYPTLAQIEGSHIILKEGITSLQTPDLISWWPFLLLSVVVYGLVLRLILFYLGVRQEQRVSDHPVFTSLVARQVVRRMQTPIVSSQALPEIDRQAAENTKHEIDETTKQETVPALEPVIVLLPDEIFDGCAPDGLAEILSRDGYRICRSHRFMVDYASDQQLLSRLAADRTDQAVAVVIIMEAWMPPLVGFQTFVHDLREQLGNLPIMVRLVGKPIAANALTPAADPAQIRIWRDKMTALGDPQLTTRELILERT